jgi:N-formylglutamate amidohydrolase
MTAHARELPDTDWHVCKLYEFSKALGASVIAANYSRYVVDLNRSHTDEVLYKSQLVTGLCPEQTFAGQEIYLPGDIKESFGCALLWDAHSIPSKVPLLFDGELPELNFGTNDGQSCGNDMIEAVITEAEGGESFSMVLDGRFKGGYITRQYGDPANDVHAIQLELAQRSYMIEESCSFDDERASRLQGVLSHVLQAFISSAVSRYEEKK